MTHTHLNKSGLMFVAEQAQEYASEPGKLIWRATVRYSNDPVTLGTCVVMNSQTYSRLMTLYIHPQVRRQSIGTALLNFACESVVSETNPIYIEADSFDVKRKDASGEMMTDDQLREFYQRHGFVPVPGHPFSLVRPARAPKS